MRVRVEFGLRLRILVESAILHYCQYFAEWSLWRNHQFLCFFFGNFADALFLLYEVTLLQVDDGSLLYDSVFSAWWRHDSGPHLVDLLFFLLHLMLQLHFKAAPIVKAEIVHDWIIGMQDYFFERVILSLDQNVHS